MPDNDYLDPADYFEAISQWSEGFTQILSDKNFQILKFSLESYDPSAQVQIGVQLIQLTLEILEQEQPSEVLAQQIETLINVTIHDQLTQQDAQALIKSNKFVASDHLAQAVNAGSAEGGQSLLDVLALRGSKKK